MNKNLALIIIFLFIVAAKKNCFAQSNKFFPENTRRIDVYINGLAKENICDGNIVFPSKYKKSKIKSDAFIIAFINAVFNSKIEEKDLDSGVKEIGRKKSSVKESLNGLIKAHDILLKGNYLKAKVRIEFIDNSVVRSKVVLTTITHAKCGVYENRMMDFKLVRDCFLKEAELSFTVEHEEMVSDSLYSTNLTSLAAKRKDYKFNIPGTGSENWLDDIFSKQYYSDSSGFYTYSKAPKDFVRLIKEDRIPVIRDLLYSPNYFVSLNAMEALIYVSSINRFKLTPELNERITQIKSESYKFMSQGAPDVFYIRDGYKDLQMTDEMIIKKYSSSM